MIKALIIDDEEQAIVLLKNLVNRYIPEVDELETALGALEGLDKIASFKPDLIFLDIEMPHLSGFDLLKRLDHWDFGIIFTTAFNKYAIQAIKFSALDYLLKPIDPDELKTAVKRFTSQKTTISDKNNQYKNLLDNVAKNNVSPFRIALPSKKGFLFFDLSKIIRLESQGNYSNFHFQKRSNLLVAKTLKEYAEILADHGFLRIHKSHLANKEHIRSYITSGTLELSNGDTLEVSRRRRTEIKRELGL